MTVDKYTTLLIIFRPKLTLAFSETESTTVLHLGNQVYTDSIKQHLIGFYDWLRNDSKELVGVDFLVRKAPYLEEELRRFPYVNTLPFPYIEVQFTNEQTHVEKYSSIQDFIEYRILKSVNGEYVIAFGTYFLDDNDLKRLKTFDVNWETPRWDPE